MITTDDLDGTEGATPVTFGIDGTSYVIDLAPQNRSRLESALAPYISAARRGGSAKAAASRPARQRADRTAVREWAREAGLKVSERGRISADIIRQYEATH